MDTLVLTKRQMSMLQQELEIFEETYNEKIDLSDYVHFRFISGRFFASQVMRAKSKMIRSLYPEIVEIHVPKVYSTVEVSRVSIAPPLPPLCSWSIIDSNLEYDFAFPIPSNRDMAKIMLDGGEAIIERHDGIPFDVWWYEKESDINRKPFHYRRALLSEKVEPVFSGSELLCVLDNAEYSRSVFVYRLEPYIIFFKKGFKCTFKGTEASGKQTYDMHIAELFIGSDIKSDAYKEFNKDGKYLFDKKSIRECDNSYPINSVTDYSLFIRSNVSQFPKIKSSTLVCNYIKGEYVLEGFVQNVGLRSHLVSIAPLYNVQIVVWNEYDYVKLEVISPGVLGLAQVLNDSRIVKVRYKEISKELYTGPFMNRGFIEKTVK